MKLYNKKVTRRFEDKIKRSVVSDRDAIVWSVDTANNVCLVKMQNSNELIQAVYPRNWNRVPSWLKPGNAVIVRHKSGVQGFMEVMGTGRAIPSPVGGGSTTPQLDALTDQIVSGMSIKAHPNGGMNIYVESGVIKVGGVNATYSAPATEYTQMDDPANMSMGSGDTMGYGSNFTATAINAAPVAGYSRYDSLFMGSDGVLDYSAGNALTLSQEPARPTTPTNHMRIGDIFIYGDMTEITQSDIGAKWHGVQNGTIAYSGTLWNASDEKFEIEYDAGAPPLPNGSMTFTAKDQYGSNINVSTTAQLSILSGSGSISTSPGGGWTSNPVSRLVGTQTTFYYQRSQGIGELTPLLSIDYDGYPYLSRYFSIELETTP